MGRSFLQKVLSKLGVKKLDTENAFKVAIGEHVGLTPEQTVQAMSKDPMKGLEESIQYHAKVLLPHVAKMMQMPMGNFRRRFSGISIKTPPKADYLLSNAWCVLDKNSFYVFVNLPLMLFCWKMGKLWATRVGVMGIPGKPNEDTKYSFDETVSIAEKLMNAFCEGRIQRDEILPAFGLTRNQTTFAGINCHYAELFVVGHEFGHAVIAYSEKQVRDLLKWTKSQASSLLSPLLNKLPDWPRTCDETSLIHHWAEEYACDSIGINLALATVHEELERIKVYWATELLMITCGMIEQFYNARKRGQAYVLTNHPFWVCRLAMLRALVDKATRQDVIDTSKFFEKLSRDIILKLGIEAFFPMV